MGGILEEVVVVVDKPLRESWQSFTAKSTNSFEMAFWRKTNVTIRHE